jgi:hypothetical protein
LFCAAANFTSATFCCNSAFCAINGEALAKARAPIISQRLQMPFN